MTWLTPAQAEYLRHEGIYVFSDVEVNMRRNALQESMLPSINEVLTPEVITSIVGGTLTPEQRVQVPIGPSEWDGVSPEER